MISVGNFLTPGRMNTNHTKSCLSYFREAETEKYSSQKGNHTLNFDEQQLRSFIAMLILSGYISLPRCSMYWEMTKNSHNSFVTALFTRNRFNEILKDLHLTDNDNIDNSDKFTKVHPLIECSTKIAYLTIFQKDI